MSTTPTQSPPSSSTQSNDAPSSEIDKFASAIAPHLPMLMFGSGDVVPSQVDPDAVAVLAELTATYVSELVQASCDAHDILTDGRSAGVIPPIPYKSSSRKRTRDEAQVKVGATSVIKVDSEAREEKGSMICDQNWENPLPPPKIRKKEKNDATNVNVEGIHNISAPYSNMQESSSSSTTTREISAKSQEWVGVQGLQAHDYIRKPYVSIPSTISKRAFIYPICHDAELYSRVNEILTNYREIKPLLLDPGIMHFIQDEDQNLESLGTSMFGWVGQSLLDSVTSAGHPKDSIITAAVKSKNSKETEAMREAARAVAMEKRKGLARRMGMEAEWPGLNEVLPSHQS